MIDLSSSSLYEILDVDPRATVAEIKRAYKLLYKSGLRLEQAVAALQELAASVPEVGLFPEFIAQSERGIIR